MSTPQNTATGTFAERAAPLLAQGIPVFPCWEKPNGTINAETSEHKNPHGKNPYTRNGLKDASADPATIAGWSSDWPGALIGVPTGEASGLFVLDIDVKNGKDGFATLRKNGWAVPPTRTHSTQTGGGLHHLFRYPEDGDFRNSAGRLGAGLDIRAKGGYVIWWPAQGCAVENDDIPFSELPEPPEWLRGELRSAKSSTEKTRAAPSDAAVIANGSRNDTLFRLACSLRERGLSEPAIEAALLVENAEKCAPPLDESEVRTITHSAGKYAPGPTGDDLMEIVNAGIILTIEGNAGALFEPPVVAALRGLRKQDEPEYFRVRARIKKECSAVPLARLEESIFRQGDENFEATYSTIFDEVAPCDAPVSGD